MSVEPWLEGRLPRTGRLALDVGANVGSFTVRLAQSFRTVHAFEPHPDAAGALRRALPPNAHSFEIAVGAAGGRLELNLYSETVHTSVYTDEDLDTLPRGPAARTLTVVAMSLDALGYADEPVDFVKIDVEGHELAVLQGARETLQTCRPGLLIEIHSTANGEACAELLAELGYEPERIAHPHTGVPDGHHWLAAPSPR